MSRTIQERDTERNSVFRTEGLTKRFGSLVAADSIDLAVPDGELHAIIGPNGAGKTTLFNMIAGSLSPSSGAVYFRGEEVTNLSMDVRARRGIVRAYQVTQLFTDLSIGENLRLAAQANGQSYNPLADTDPAHRERATEMFTRLGIDSRLTDDVSALSHGNKKKIGIGMALLVAPELLLLDEPTSGLSENDSQQIIEFLVEETENLTTLLIEHDVEMVLSVSDRITVLHQGEVIARGNPDEIEDDEAVKEAYLGGY